MSYIQSLLKDPEGLASSLTATPRGVVEGSLEDPASPPEAFPDEPEEDDLGFGDYAGDTVMGVVRGGEGFLKSLAGAVDMVTGGGDGEMFGVDLESNWSGTSQTMPGAFVQGASQFLFGFLPILGWLSKGQKLSSLGKFAGIARSTTAAAAADAISFDGQYQRLSNLLVQYPALKVPVTEYLAADEDDEEWRGRLKNTIEGLAIGGTVGIAGAIVKGISFLKFAQKGKAKGMTPDQIREAWNKRKESKQLKKELEKEGIPTGLAGKDPSSTSSASLLSQAKEVTRDISPDATKPGVGVKAAGKEELKPGGEAAIDTTSKQIDRLEGIYSRKDVDSWIKESTDELRESDKFLGTFKGFREDTIANRELLGEDASVFKNISVEEIEAGWKGREGLFRELAIRQDRAWLGVRASAEQVNKTADTFVSKPNALNEQAFKDSLERHQNFMAEYTSYGRGASFLFLGRQARHQEGSASAILDSMRGAEVNDAINSIPSAKGSRTAEGATLSRDIDELSRVSDPKVSKGVEQQKEKRISEIDERLKEGVDDETATALKKEKSEKERSLKEQKKLTETLEELEKVRAMSPKQQAKHFKQKQAKQKRTATKDLTEAQKRTKTVQKELNDLKREAQKPAKELKNARARLETKREKLNSLRKQLLVSKRLIEAEPPKVKAEKTGELKRIEDEIKALEGAEKFYGRMIKDEKLGEDAVKTINENATLSAERLKEIERELKIKRDKFPKDTKGAGATLRKKAAEQRQALVKDAKVRLKALDLETEQEFGKFINTTLGSGDARTLAKRYSFLSNIEDPVQRLFAVNNYSKAHLHTKLMDGTLQAFMGSLLSAPSTLLINALGPSIAMGLKNLEVAIGSAPGAFAGDVVAKARLRAVFNVVGFFEDVATSFRNFQTSWRQDESAFLGSARAWDENLKGKGAFAPEVWNKQGTAAEQGLTWMNNISRLPMKFLGATDDFYKTLAAHQFVRQEAMVEAVAKHGMTDGRQIADYVTQTVDSHMLKNTHDGSVSIFSEKGLVVQALKEMKAKGIKTTEGAAQTKALYKYIEDNQRSPQQTRLSEGAVKYAKDVTFTKELEGPVGSKVAAGLRELPVFKLVVPFLRTPWNILGFGLSRNPIGALTEQTYKSLMGQAGAYREVMENGTGREIVELKGRLSASVGYTAALMWYIKSNGDKISGYGPENKEEREALRATGWQPYSVRMGDKWISYQRVDPITTILGVLADYNDAQTYQEDIQGSDGLFSAVSLSVAFNITDRSYLRGLNNVLNAARDLETYGPKLFKDITAGFVPNILNKTQDTGFFNDDDEGRRMIRETRGLADAMLRRIPGAGENIPPKRTVLGDPVYRDNVLGILEPANFAQVSRVSKSLVDNEIANLRHGFSKPEKNFRGIPELNLTEIYNSQGRQAYDRWLELSSEVKINGRTLKQSLKKLFQSSGYKSIPEHIPHEQTGKKTPRVSLANKVIRAYRRRAQYQMLKEFPELVKGFKDARQLYYEQATQGNPIPTP